MATERRPVRVPDETLRRIRNEYLEMPGLCLTLEQARRLWDLDEETCNESLQFLVETTFLCRAVVDAGVSPGSTIRFRRAEPVALLLDRRPAA